MLSREGRGDNSEITLVCDAEGSGLSCTWGGCTWGGVGFSQRVAQVFHPMTDTCLP